MYCNGEQPGGVWNVLARRLFHTGMGRREEVLQKLAEHFGLNCNIE